MYWYQITGYWFGADGSRVFKAGESLCSAFESNDILYGLTDKYPELNLYYNRPTGIDRLVRIYATGVGAIVDFSSSKNLYRYGYPFLVKSSDVLSTSDAYIKALSNSTIAGKRKFKNVLTSIPKLAYCLVPVSFSIDNNNYDGFTFSNVKRPWYVKVTEGTSTEKHLELFGWSGDGVRQANIDNITCNVVALFSKDNFSNENQYENFTFITDDFTQWSNKVIDFGEIPQDVPLPFKEWIEAVTEEYFPYYYTVNSFDGSTQLAQLTESPSMTNALLIVIGNQKTLTLTGSNGQTYAMQWTSETPEGKQFLGLSTSPNSNRPTLLANTETAVSWTGDLVFYESYGTYRPPTTVFDINLYQNSAEVNRVDKGQFLVGVGTLSGALREECSMLTPSIVYQSADVPTFNYVYIPIFNRYYFVTSLSSVSKNVWRMELNCDVLMSYKNEILLLQGVVGRQEIDFNEFLVDDKLPAQKDAIVEFLNPLSTTLTPFDTQKGFNDYIYVLTVVG